jgi:uncharacterized protein (PEP-CTERM system associated)
MPLASAISVFVTTLAFASAAYALDWRIEPTLEASAIYTDNANHSEDDPEGAVILRATPGVTLSSEGSRRVQATLQYGLSGVARFGEKESTDLLHRLNAIGNAELVEDFLFIDGSARVSQQLISLEGPLVEAEISDRNRATVGTYSVSPYVQKRLGTFANAQARYTASGAIFENNVAANTSANTLTAALTNGTRFDDLSWGLNYFIRKAGYDDDLPDSTFERAYASLGYALTRKFRVFGTVGEEWNDYLSATETDGSSWSAGFGWSPSRRTSLEASVGERYFGNTYNVSLQHRTRASTWNVSYVEDLNDISQFMLTSGTVYNYLCPGPGGAPQLFPDWPFNFPPAPGCVPFGGMPGPVFDLRNGVFISKVLRAGVGWGTGKLHYSLDAFDSLRDYQLDNSEDSTRGVTAAATYRVAPKTSAHGSLGLNRYELSSTSSGGGFFPTLPREREDDIYTLTLGVDHQFDPDLSGTVTYQHQQRDSNVANGDFQENRITGTVNMSF